MNKLSEEKQIQVLSALVEGNSIRSTERMTGVHRDTIMRLGVKVGEACMQLMSEEMKDIEMKSIHIDEIWAFVEKKQKNVKSGEIKRNEKGDQYTFVAIDADTKLAPVFITGKRNGISATEFLLRLRQAVKNRPQITSDGFKPYVDAVETVFGCEVDFAQLIKVYESEQKEEKRYSPPNVVETKTNVIKGNPDREKISTSFVERQNLTMRMCMRRFTRLTNAFSKKLKNLKAAIALHFAHYNFCRIHQTLKVTPAMEAGITDHVWSWDELLKVVGI